MRKIITAIGSVLAMAGVSIAFVGSAPAASAATAGAVVTGSGVSCAVVSPGGELRCWGTNTAGQLGVSAAIPRSTTPLSVEIPPVSQVALGEGTHACAVLFDGTVSCWGANAQGQLGDGTTTSHPLPAAVRTSSVSPEPLIAVRQVTVGGEHTCAAMLDGGVRCWGNGSGGRLGNGASVSQSAPVEVRASSSDASPLQGVQQVSAGNSHTCALLATGTVKCWGNNGSGRLGDGTSTSRTSPVDVRTSVSMATPLTGVVQIAAGAFHTCALLETGGVRCWGQNVSSAPGTFAGQLGDGTATSRTSPVEVIGLPGPAVQVAAGQYHTCAVLGDGDLWCWGHNGNGRLAVGSIDTANHLQPQHAAVTGVAQVATGVAQTCARSISGSLRCWGANAQGQLGNGSQTDTASPTVVSGFEDPEPTESPSPDPDPEPTESPSPDPDPEPTESPSPDPDPSEPQETATSFVTIPRSSVIGEQVHLVADVSPVPDGGVIAFMDAGIPVRGCAVRPVDTLTGEASCTFRVRPKDAGKHAFIAAFEGAPGFAPSSSPEFEHIMAPRIAKVRAVHVAGAEAPIVQVSASLGTVKDRPLSKKFARALSRRCALRITVTGSTAPSNCAWFRPAVKRFVAPVALIDPNVDEVGVAIAFSLAGEILAQWEGVVTVQG
jgi:alpha-tubulin suppressor-like RCC1 family protein